MIHKWSPHYFQVVLTKWDLTKIIYTHCQLNELMWPNVNETGPWILENHYKRTMWEAVIILSAFPFNILIWSILKPGENEWHFTVNTAALRLWLHHISPCSQSPLMEITDSFQPATGAYPAVTRLAKSVLFSAYLSSFLGADGLQLWREWYTLSWLPSGTFSGLAIPQSLQARSEQCLPCSGSTGMTSHSGHPPLRAFPSHPHVTQIVKQRSS